MPHKVEEKSKYCKEVSDLVCISMMQSQYVIWHEKEAFQHKEPWSQNQEPVLSFEYEVNSSKDDHTSE